MRHPFKGSIVSLLAVLAFSSVAVAQARQPQVDKSSPNIDLCSMPSSNTDQCIVDELTRDPRPAGPAPKRDLTGAWAGPTNSDPTEVPPMTPLGKKIFGLNKSQRKFPLSEANDPFDRCDPLGMPRTAFEQTRGIMFAQMPDRMLLLRQYDRVWREIFTDGRELPKNVGGTGKDALDPRWYGYSVGHWDGDYTFVVDTIGTDDRSWVDYNGDPHSVDMHVEERYTRVDHNTLQLTVTMDDPKIYAKPFVAKNHFRWLPKQEVDQQICVASEAQEYLNFLGPTDGDGPPAQKK